MSLDSVNFDVAMSFAGEDRTFVEAIADILLANNLLVFYDRHFEADLLGVDLVTALRAIYAERSRYCVVFVSEHYRSKKWPNRVERTAILERSTRQEDAYLLPVVLDGSWLDGVPTTLGFVDARDRSPESVADVILKKVGRAIVPPTERDLFRRLAFEPKTLGTFLVNFRDTTAQQLHRWSGDTTSLHRLKGLAELLSQYDMCTFTTTIGDADMDFYIAVTLTAKGIRFRNYLFNEFLLRDPRP